jgi:hypothetical protein
MSSQQSGHDENDFLKQGQAKREGFISEYLHLLSQNKKWWMLPLILILLGFGVLMVLSSSGVAPFIYTLF